MPLRYLSSDMEIDSEVQQLYNANSIAGKVKFPFILGSKIVQYNINVYWFPSTHQVEEASLNTRNGLRWQRRRLFRVTAVNVCGRISTSQPSNFHLATGCYASVVAFIAVLLPRTELSHLTRQALIISFSPFFSLLDSSSPSLSPSL